MSVAMHEIPTTANSPTERPNLRLVIPLTAPSAREVWIAEMTDDIIAARHLDRQSAYQGATLAASWLEDYQETKDSYVSMEWSREFQVMLPRRGRDPKGAMLASFERVADDLVLDSVRLAAIYGFCEGLEEPTADVWALLTIEEA